MAWFIGVDSGTQSTRAVLVDGRDGHVAAASAVGHDLLAASEPGQREQNPRDWIDAVSAAMEAIDAALCGATDRWLPLVCTMNVTVATEMVRRQFDLDHDGLSRAAATAPAGADGLLLVPFFEGERTPNCPDGTGVWLGLREKTAGAAHAARAAMEGTTLGLNYGLNRLRELGIAPREIRLTGGGAKSAVWRQIAADIFDCPVVCPVSVEGAAYGAAMHAMWVWERQHGRDASIRDLTERFVHLDEKTRAAPDPARAAIYRTLQELFDRTARDLGAVFALHRRFIT